MQLQTVGFDNKGPFIPIAPQHQFSRKNEPFHPVIMSCLLKQVTSHMMTVGGFRTKLKRR